MNQTSNPFKVVADAIEEAKKLQQLRHPNIVQYIDVFGHQQWGDTLDDEERRASETAYAEGSPPDGQGVCTSYLCIVTEYCDKGPLSDAVFDHGLAQGEVLEVLRQVRRDVFEHCCNRVPIPLPLHTHTHQKISLFVAWL